MKRLQKFAADSGGASVVEYALVLGLCVAGLAAALPMLGSAISGSVSTSASAAASSPVVDIASPDGKDKGKTDVDVGTTPGKSNGKGNN